MERLGKYEIKQRLGKGGFGVVWKALDTDLQIYRALKEPENMSPALEAELKEARVQAQLDHPNIVRMIGTERLEGRFFLVTEFIEGKTLRDRLSQGGPIPKEEADEIFSQILEGLAYAHKRGIAHLDLKPENIFLTKDNVVKIGDFGLARILDKAEVMMTEKRGTLAYMSPEQLDGKATLSADIWAAGAIAYELYSGSMAISGNTDGERVKNIISGNIRQIASVPEKRREVVASMLKPDQATRCPSASSALAKLDEMRGILPPLDKRAMIQMERQGLGFFKIPVAVMLLISVLVTGYGISTGAVNFGWMDSMRASIEGEPDAPKPPSGFYALPETKRLDKAWQYADDGEFGKAYRAADEIALSSDIKPESKAEALYLKANMAAYNLSRPWHAVISLKDYLAQNPKGKNSMAARLLLAEVLINQGLPRAGLDYFDEAVRTDRGNPMLSDSVVLAERYEKTFDKDKLMALRALKPNNVVSLILTALSVIALLMPLVLLSGMGGFKKADGSRRPAGEIVKIWWGSKVCRALYIGFITFNCLQFYLNRLALATDNERVHHIIGVIKGMVG